MYCDFKSYLILARLAMPILTCRGNSVTTLPCDEQYQLGFEGADSVLSLRSLLIASLDFGRPALSCQTI